VRSSQDCFWKGALEGGIFNPPALSSAPVFLRILVTVSLPSLIIFVSFPCSLLDEGSPELSFCLHKRNTLTRQLHVLCLFLSHIFLFFLTLVQSSADA